MNTIERLRQPPILIGGIVAGLLLLTVVGVVRNAGAAGVDAMQNNVGAAVARPVQPTTIPAASILAIGTTKVDPNDGYKWAWLGAVWLSCRHLDTLSFAYNANANDLALLTWQTMTAEDKREIAGVCR